MPFPPPAGDRGRPPNLAAPWRAPAPQALILGGRWLRRAAAGPQSFTLVFVGVLLLYFCTFVLGFFVRFVCLQTLGDVPSNFCVPTSTTSQV